MKTYTTNGMRAVSAESMGEAAGIFAGRKARREFGKSGYCRTVRQDAWAEDGSLAEFEAFIGYTPAGKHNRGSTVGRNVRFTVYCSQNGLSA